MLSFQVGRNYSRADIKELAGLPRQAKGGNWDTGIVEHEGQFLIFANLGIPGQTGHDYDNQWEGGLLRWYHKNGSHREWPSVKRLLQDGSIVHVFWRNSNAPAFAYAGNAKAVTVRDASPVEIHWSFDLQEGPD